MADLEPNLESTFDHEYQIPGLMAGESSDEQMPTPEDLAFLAYGVATEPPVALPESETGLEQDPGLMMPEEYLVPSNEGVIEVDPDTLGTHRYAELLPLMRPNEFRALCDVIALNGQQVPAILFRGKLLDGRNRARACAALGITLRVIAYTGSEMRALMYVLDANQHHRDLGKSQRAAVAATLLPVFAGDVAAERIEKIRSARLAALGKEIRINLSKSPSEHDSARRSRDLAADLMGVSPAYVQWALRIQRERPDLFEQLWNGALKMPTAMAELVPPADAELRKQVAALRGRVGKWLRRAQERPEFLAALTEFLDRFDGTPGEGVIGNR